MSGSRYGARASTLAYVAWLKPVPSDGFAFGGGCFFHEAGVAEFERVAEEGADGGGGEFAVFPGEIDLEAAAGEPCRDDSELMQPSRVADGFRRHAEGLKRRAEERARNPSPPEG